MNLRRFALFVTLTVAAVTPTATVGDRTVSPSLYADLSWRCIGPFDGGPVASVVGIPGEPGVYTITTPSGGVWKTIDGGDTWTSVESQRVAAGPDPQRWIDSANPRRIVRTDANGIEVSLDGGETWVAFHHLPIAEVASLSPRSIKTEAGIPKRSIAGKPVNVSIADTVRAGLIFAGTNDSVYVSFDNGVNWDSLRLNLPAAAINDLDIRGSNLVAATQGRSIWQLDDISPLRQLSAASTSAAAILFKPLDAILVTPDSGSDTASPPAEVNIDYYLGTATRGELKLDILDRSGRVIHSATSATADSTDYWLPVIRPLPSTPGRHRVLWNLRLDPPPAQNHRYAQLARALMEDTPPDPDGPLVLPGSYRVRLTVAGRLYSQPIVVHNDPRVGESPPTLAAQRKRFDLEMKVYDAMRIVHREFLQLSTLRHLVKPLLTSPDPELALVATDLDTRLADLDGSDWITLIIPDADNEEEFDEKEGIKHPDFVPSVPVSISKDYDDPTSILGRAFNNGNHAPALATLSTGLGGMLTKTIDSVAAPDATAIATYVRSCRQLSDVLDQWRAINLQDLPIANAELAKRGLPALPIAARVSTIACGSKQP